MKKIGLILIGLMLVTSLAHAATYVGRAEKITATERGISFDMVVIDKDTDKEVLRRNVWIGTGNQSGEEAKAALTAYIDKITQEMYNHIEGGKVVVADKITLEAYRKEVNKYVDTKVVVE